MIRKNLSSLKKIASSASGVVLATDPDREGEAIAFHLADALRLKNYQQIREKSRQKCPQCQERMDKIPSKSKKLSRPYFLKCSKCEVVMFFNQQQKTWLEPTAKPVPTITEYPCPVCGSFLAEKTYSKNDRTKKMLVCSTKQGKHEDVLS